jgi:FkbM family methyltransferase
MDIRKAIKSYYAMFGYYGVYLAAKSRLLKEFPEVQVLLPGYKEPVHLRLRTSDTSTFWQVLVTEEYDSSYIKVPEVIVDAGANIGLTSVFYANKYPNAKIVAIEPESSNYAMLVKNTASYPNIRHIHAALWKANRYLDVVDPHLGHFGFQTVETRIDAAGECERVPAITLTQLMSDHHISYIDILKIDIEGAELEVFETASDWIDRVGVIIIELHERTKPGCERSVRSATKDFESEWRKGESIFLARKSYAAGDDILKMPAVDSLQPRQRPPFRIQ